MVGAEASAELAALRAEIEAIDRELVALLGRRLALARRVGVAKQHLGLPILDPRREAAVVRHAGEIAREMGIGDDDVRYLFWQVIAMSRRAQLEAH